MLNYSKGQGLIASLFIFMIFAFIIVLVSVLFVYMGDRVETALKGVDVKTSQNWTEIVENSMGGVNRAYDTLHWLTTFVILGYVLAIFIGCFFSKEHPVMFIIYIFISVIAVIISVPIANSYYTLYLNTELNPTFLGFESASYILFHLPTFMIVLGLVGGTIMVTRIIKGRSEG